MTSTSMGLKERAIQAATKEVEEDQKAQIARIAKILKDKFDVSIDVDTSSYPVEVDGLKFKMSYSGEIWGSVLLVAECSMCGKEAILGDASNITELGKLLLNEEENLCFNCKAATEPTIAKLITSLKELYNWEWDDYENEVL
jgi:hypothetical protein